MNTTKHVFQSAKADGPDAALLQPSAWNAEHAIGVSLTNKTGGQLVSGDVVGLDDGNDEAVELADTLDTTRALVVALETIANDAAGLFTATGAWTLKVSTATTRGNYLAKSATTKALYDTGVAAVSNPPPAGAVAIALTSAVGAGTVVGLLLTSGAGGSGGALFNGGNAASASALNVGNSGAFFHVTGTTQITSISTRVAGHIVVLVFNDALTIVHNATTLILQGGLDYVTSAGDVLIFISEGSGNWRQVAPNHEVLSHVQASTSLRVGTNPASQGAIRLANQGTIQSRNAGNDGDVVMLSVDNQDRPVLGAVGDNIVVAGQLRADIETGARVVLPVGTNRWAV